MPPILDRLDQKGTRYDKEGNFSKALGIVHLDIS